MPPRAAKGLKEEGAVGGEGGGNACATKRLGKRGLAKEREKK